jgi:hypothetical protein
LSLIFRFGKQTDAETSVNSDAFITGLPKMRVLNVARVGQTHTKCSAVSFSNWQDAQTGLVVSPILWRCLLRQQCPVIIKIRILSCFLGMAHEVFGCLQLWVFNPKLGLSTAVKCDPVFRVCVNDPLSIHIPDH